MFAALGCCAQNVRTSQVRPPLSSKSDGLVSAQCIFFFFYKSYHVPECNSHVNGEG